MPDLTPEIEDVLRSLPAVPKGLPELRQMLAALPPLSTSYLPGSAPAMLPESDGTVASSPGGAGTVGGELTTGLPPGSLPGSSIIPGSLPATVFVSTLSVPKIVDELPTLPAAGFPLGSLAFLTTDGKLYRNVLNVWTAEVDTSDLTGVIGETQIDDGAISTPKLQAGLVKAEHLATNAVTADKILAGSVTAAALASEIILASLIRTATAGARIEIDQYGIRAYGSGGQLLVNIPTNGVDPVSVVGAVEASSLVSTASAELRGTTELASGSVTTAQVGVTNPTAAPGVVSSLDSLTLGTTPPYPGHGLCFDTAGDVGGATDTFWIGADPTTGNLLDMAYEYRKSDGALLRTIRKTGTTTTLSATAGYTGHQSDLAYGYTGTTNDQFAVSIVMPSDRGNMTIKKVSVYLAGREGTCQVRNMVWNTSTPGAVLGQSATYTAVDKGATNAGDSVQYNRDLSSPVVVAPGATIRAGAARMSSLEGWQIDTDTAAGATGYIGDGANGSFSPWGTFNDKPNVYVTYDYEVDSSVEGTTGKIVGVARAGSYVFVLDANGVLFQYNQADLTYVGKTDLSAYITGTKANAGLFYDGTNLIITTATGTTGTDQVKFVKVNATTRAYVSAHNATGLSINGSTSTVRGGYYDATNYWVALTGTATGVYAFSASTYANVANRDFGLSGEIGSGVTWDESVFRGWSSTSPTKVWTFTGWDWTTESAVYWACYTWYDSVATTHETAVSPRASITLGRRRRLTITNPAIPGAGSEPPDKVRVYLARGAGDPGGTNYDRQAEDALTTRTLTTYDTGGAANPASNDFPVGTAAEIKSATTGWSFKGNGFAAFGGTSFPASPTSGDHYYRTDLQMWFVYDGTRWLCTCPHEVTGQNVGLTWPLSADTGAGLMYMPIPDRGMDIRIEKVTAFFYVTGGSALSASHKWAITLRTDPGSSTVGTITIDSGASDAYRWLTDSTGYTVDMTSSQVGIDVGFDETGTPGTLRASVVASYRYVAT